MLSWNHSLQIVGGGFALSPNRQVEDMNKQAACRHANMWKAKWYIGYPSIKQAPLQAEYTNTKQQQYTNTKQPLPMCLNTSYDQRLPTLTASPAFHSNTAPPQIIHCPPDHLPTEISSILTSLWFFLISPLVWKEKEKNRKLALPWFAIPSD